MEKLSEHFSFDELTHTSKYELLEANRQSAKAFMKQLKYVVGTLEEIREVLEVPLRVTSGFRNNALNKAVGGSPTSGHTKGLCADFIPIGMDVIEAFTIIQTNRDKCPSLKKCIYESVYGSEWLHIETKTEVNQPQQFFTTTNGKSYTEIKV